uniref:Si:ch211-214j8.12 n=1 Tax=Sphaeramia orbicularis TaxID=375764 RepID=A0A672Z6N0_9TELE
MPLFGRGKKGLEPRQKKTRSGEFLRSRRMRDEDGHVASLTRLCLLSLADNMKEVWVKDYAEKYLDRVSFRYIMGPFNLLPGELVEELTLLLCSRKQLSRPALHLLLVPQLRSLSLEGCPGLVTSALCAQIAARCQGLYCLDLSGAQQLPSKALSETLCCLPSLRSLSLAGTPSDSCVIRVVAEHCRLLRHLDVSRCHLLSPAALLVLGGGAVCFLLALDIGFGEQEADPVAMATYLLLTLPDLEKVALEGIGQACSLILHREFDQMDEFTDREGVPRMEKVWKECRHRQDMGSWKKKEAATTDKEEEEKVLFEGHSSESEEDAVTDEELNCFHEQADDKRGRGSGEDCLTLALREVQGLSCDSLDSLRCLCPDISTISVNIDDCNDAGTRRRNGSLLARGLQTWSGQLQSLSVQYSGPMEVLFHAIDVTGSSLVSLTLEGVKTSHHTPLLEVIRVCPRLRNLHITADPPTMVLEEEDMEDVEAWHDDVDLPRLPHLSTLTLNFSYEHSQMKPCLLAGSPLLEKISLVSVPCPLDCIFKDLLHPFYLRYRLNADPQAFQTLGRVQHLNLTRSDMMIDTVKLIIQQSRSLKVVDLSYCWNISKFHFIGCQRLSKVKLIWV